MPSSLLFIFSVTLFLLVSAGAEEVTLEVTGAVGESVVEEKHSDEQSLIEKVQPQAKTVSPVKPMRNPSSRPPTPAELSSTDSDSAKKARYLDDYKRVPTRFNVNFTPEQSQEVKKPVSK